jgi:hypothetical protein
MYPILYFTFLCLGHCRLTIPISFHCDQRESKHQPIFSKVKHGKKKNVSLIILADSFNNIQMSAYPVLVPLYLAQYEIKDSTNMFTFLIKAHERLKLAVSHITNLPASVLILFFFVVHR